jgi:hypothetical protein
MPGKARRDVSRSDWLKFILGYCMTPIVLVAYLLAIDWHAVALTLFSTDENIQVHPIAQILLAPAQFVIKQPLSLTLHLVAQRIGWAGFGIVGLIAWSFLYMAITVLPIWLLLKVTFGLKYQKAKLITRIWPQNEWANRVIALKNQKPAPPRWLQEARQQSHAKPINPPTPVNPFAIKGNSPSPAAQTRAQGELDPPVAANQPPTMSV